MPTTRRSFGGGGAGLRETRTSAGPGSRCGADRPRRTRAAIDSAAARSLRFDEDGVRVDRTGVLADVFLRTASNSFVRRFLNLNHAVSDGKPSPEVTKRDEKAVRMLVGSGSVTMGYRSMLRECVTSPGCSPCRRRVGRGQPSCAMAGRPHLRFALTRERRGIAALMAAVAAATSAAAGSAG